MKGKKFYTLTADYLFGHDLRGAANAFFAANGGNPIGWFPGGSAQVEYQYRNLFGRLRGLALEQKHILLLLARRRGDDV